MKSKNKPRTNFLSRGNNTCEVSKAKMIKIFSRNSKNKNVCGSNREQVVWIQTDFGQCFVSYLMCNSSLKGRI